MHLLVGVWPDWISPQPFSSGAPLAQGLFLRHAESFPPLYMLFSTPAVVSQDVIKFCDDAAF